MSLSFKMPDFDPKKIIENRIREELLQCSPQFKDEINKLKFIYEGDNMKFNLDDVSNEAKESFIDCLQKYKK